MSTVDPLGAASVITTGQMAMWLGAKFASPDTNFNLAEAIEIEGWIDPDVFMAAMRQADSVNAAKLREAFPETWAELDARYNAPGGILPGEVAA